VNGECVQSLKKISFYTLGATVGSKELSCSPPTRFPYIRVKNQKKERSSPTVLVFYDIKMKIKKYKRVLSC